jgi:hypothetical protein
LIHAGKGIEQGGFAGVGIADEGDQRRAKGNHYRSGEWGDANSAGFVATETQSIIAQADFHWIAKGGEAKDLNFLSFQKPHLHKPLHQSILSLDFIDASALADLELVERRHGRSSRTGSDWPDKDLRSQFTAQAQPALADLKQAGSAGLKHSKATSDAQPQFGQSANPVLFARYLGDVCPGVAVQQFQRKEFGGHGVLLREGVVEIQSQ